MYAFITYSEKSKLNLWSRFSFLGPVEHFQKDDNFCQLSVITMNSTKYITKVLLLLIGVLGFGGVGPINNHNLNMVNFLRSQGLHALSERFPAEDSFCCCQLGANTGELYCSFTFANDRILRLLAVCECKIIVTHFAGWLSLLQMIVFYVSV